MSTDLYEIEHYNSDVPEEEINPDENELSLEQKLELSERANAIYRIQFRYMQQHHMKH